MNEYNINRGIIVKRAFFTLCAFGVLCLLVAAANAGTILVTNPTNMFYQNEATQFKIVDYENIYDSSGKIVDLATTPVVPGDTLRGIFNITSAQDQSGNVKYPNGFGLPGGFQLTGLFDTVISAVSGLDYTVTPNPSFAAEVGGKPGTMIAIYDNTPQAFTASGTIASTEASATAGSLWMTLGAPTPNSVWGTNYYWSDIGSTTPGVSSFTASLALLDNNTGVPSANFLSIGQLPSSVLGQPALALILNAGGLQGTTAPISYNGVPYAIQSQDPLTMSVVPEPSSLALVGTFFGVLAAALAAYRRKGQA